MRYERRAAKPFRTASWTSACLSNAWVAVFGCDGDGPFEWRPAALSSHTDLRSKGVIQDGAEYNLQYSRDGCPRVRTGNCATTGAPGLMAEFSIGFLHSAHDAGLSFWCPCCRNSCSASLEYAKFSCFMAPDLKSKIISLLATSPMKIGDLPGEVFSTGSSAISPGDLYVAGLNPGFGTAYRKVRSHVEDWSLEHYSAYLDQCWNERCWNEDCYGKQEKSSCKCKRGTNAHQKAVQQMIHRARPGLDPRNVFATNAVFVKSDSAATFRKETGFTMFQAFESCWPVHQLFLSIVQPRVILSLGYAEGTSAFSLFGRKAARVGDSRSFSVPGRKFASFKWRNMTFDIGEQQFNCLVVGVRHPSYVPDATNTKEFSDLFSTDT